MPHGVSSSCFLILYGSQKGQAQSIAEQLSDQAAEHGFEAEVSCLSKEDKVGHAAKFSIGQFKNISINPTALGVS